MACCFGFPRPSCDRVLPGGGVASGSCGGWKPCPGQPCCRPSYRPMPCDSPCDKGCCPGRVCIPISYPCPCKPCPRPKCGNGSADANTWPPNYGAPATRVHLNINNGPPRNSCTCYSSVNCPSRCGKCGRQGPTLNEGTCPKDDCHVPSPCVSNGINYKDGCGPPYCRPCCARPCCNPMPPCCLTIRPCEPKCCPSRCCKLPPFCCPNPCDPKPDPRCCPKPMILSFRCPTPGPPTCPREPCPIC